MIRLAQSSIAKRKRGLEFSEWLKEQLRQRPDLNQKRLAELLGVYASTVSFWISGRAKPSLDKVDALATIFNIERNALYQILGHDVQPYEFKIIGPLVEEIDKLLASVDSPEERRLIEERLKSDIRAARDMLETLDQMRHRKDEGD